METLRWRTLVDDAVLFEFSMGHSDFCLAEEGGSTGAVGSGAVPRDSCEPVRGTTSVDEVVLFDINTSPEFVTQEGRFFCGTGQSDFLFGASSRKQWSQWKRKDVPPRHWNPSGNNLDRRCCFVSYHDGLGFLDGTEQSLRDGNKRKQRGHRK